MNKRVPYIAISVFAFLACAAIFFWADKHSFVRGTLGDAIVVMIIYGGILSILPRLPRIAVAGGVFVFACCIEGLQSHVIPSLLDTSKPIVAATLGSTFDWHDIGAYFVGILLIFVFDMLLIRPRIRD